MQPEDFLLSIKDDINFVQDAASGKIIQYATDAEKLAGVKETLDHLIRKIEAHRQSPEMAPHCGLYLSDGDRQYGYTFEQLQQLLADYNNPKSVFHKRPWGTVSLLKWLYEVSSTSIGDLHGDLPKHVVVTYHRPSDFSDEELNAKDKEYETFWKEVRKIIGSPI